MDRLLLKNCFHIQPSADGEALRGGDILVEGGLISRIGTDLEAGEAARTVDCSTHVVVAGFVNTHHHFFQTLTRNLPAVQDAKLFDWLTHLYGIWERIDDEAVHVSSLLAMGELLKTGCTTTTDHLYLYPHGFGADFMDLQFQAAARLGVRFCPARGSMSRGRSDGGLPPDSVVQDEEDILVDCERAIRGFHDPSPHAMRKVALAPCSPFSVSEELLRQTVELARRNGVRLHTHLAETADEDAFCVEKYGVRPLALMERCGFLGPHVSFAHGIHFDDGELAVLARSGAQIAHCPSSNMRLGSGICRVRDMLDRGIPVSLAVDGSASNDTSDFLAEMRQAMLLQRVARGSGALGARETLKMATETGAAVLGFPGEGVLAEGRHADIAVFDVSGPEFSGSLSDPLAALLFCGTSHEADYVVCDGRLVVDGGRLTGIDEEDLARDGRRISSRLTGARTW